MNKKIFAAIMLFVIFIGGYVYREGQKSPAEKFVKPIMKIGIIAPMTGTNSELGKNCVQGIKYALSGLQTSLISYKLIVDDGSSSETAGISAKKLIDKDKVNALIVCSTLSAASAVPVAAEKRTPVFSIMASNSALTEPSKYSFWYGTSPEKEAELLLKILKAQSVRKVVLLMTEDSEIKELAKAAVSVMEKAKMDVTTYALTSEKHDSERIVSAAVSEKADQWILLVLPEQMKMIDDEMRKSNIKTPYTTMEVPLRMTDKTMFEGINFVGVPEGHPELMKRYGEYYRTKNLYGVAFAYDVMVIIDQLTDVFYKHNGRLPNGEELVSALQKQQRHRGTLGDVEIDGDGSIKVAPQMMRVKNGHVIVSE